MVLDTATPIFTMAKNVIISMEPHSGSINFPPENPKYVHITGNVKVDFEQKKKHFLFNID